MERAGAMIDRPEEGRRQGITSTDRGWTWQEESAVAFAGGDYEIRIKGRLSDSLLAAFEGLTTTEQPVETVLYGPVQDQAALYRLLDQIQSPRAGRDPPDTGISRRGSSRARAPTASSVGWCSTSTVRLSTVCAAQVRGRVQPAPDNPSGDGWWTATRTATAAGSNPGLTLRLAGPAGNCR
jgi:hypothetical protein